MKKNTIKLCHGTGARLLETILSSGLRPRGERQSAWGQCPSHPDRVYLTNAYAFYFAQNVVDYEEDLLIVEVEVDVSKLVPDEDFLGQSSKGTDWEADYPDLIERTLVMRDAVDKMPRRQRQLLAISSIENLGNAAHIGRIFPAALRRIARVPHRQISQIVMQEFDPTISIANYRLMGERYRSFQESLFERFPL